jgi:hypothetical protein
LSRTDALRCTISDRWSMSPGGVDETCDATPLVTTVVEPGPMSR